MQGADMLVVNVVKYVGWVEVIVAEPETLELIKF
jgi:hypothetical protein